MKNLLLSFVFVILVASIESSRILCFHPSPSKSHVIVSQALMKALAIKGHDVTVVSAFPQKKAIENYRDIYVPLKYSIDHITAGFLDGSLSTIKGLTQLSQITTDLTNSTIHDPQFQKLMKEEQFDLIIFGYFISDFQLGLSYHFNCPSIVLLTVGTKRLTNQFIGNPSEVAAVPHLLLAYKRPMTFLQRVINMLMNVAEYGMLKLTQGLQKKYYESNFPSDKYPPYHTVTHNISLLLTNDHFSQGDIRPNLPNLVQVGGLQVKDKPSPLPENIQQFLDGAEHGAIFFSLGSNLKSSLLSKDKLDNIVRAFSQLKQRVIFKWESDKLPGQSDNMLIGKWLPQDDILAHKNVVMFVSHGGLGSVVESKYHGVPLVGLPIFGDQKTNVAAIQAEGWGIALNFKELTHESLTDAINDILTNSTYKKTAEKLSRLYRDRPQSAMETAIYWVEYVIRHKGAYHMRYQGVDLNILQTASIDVLLFLAVVFYFIFKIARIMFKVIKSRFLSSRSKLKTQ